MYSLLKGGTVVKYMMCNAKQVISKFPRETDPLG